MLVLQQRLAWIHGNRDAFFAAVDAAVDASATAALLCGLPNAASSWFQAAAASLSGAVFSAGFGALQWPPAACAFASLAPTAQVALQAAAFVGGLPVVAVPAAALARCLSRLVTWKAVVVRARLPRLWCAALAALAWWSAPAAFHALLRGALAGTHPAAAAVDARGAFIADVPRAGRAACAAAAAAVLVGLVWGAARHARRADQRDRAVHACKRVALAALAVTVRDPVAAACAALAIAAVAFACARRGPLRHLVGMLLPVSAAYEMVSFMACNVISVQTGPVRRAGAVFGASQRAGWSFKRHTASCPGGADGGAGLALVSSWGTFGSRDLLHQFGGRFWMPPVRRRPP